mgnify:CR=1 FL=1
MASLLISKHKLVDGYIIFSLFLVPSSFLGLISFRFFYIPGLFDLRLLSWLLALPLLFIYWRSLPEISNNFSGKLLIFVALFVLVRFIISFFQGISFREAFTVFRMGFNTPISCLAFLCFFYSADIDRIERIFKWGFIFFTLNLVLYFLNYSGLGIYDNIKDINEETIGGITITRNLTGIPIYFSVFFILSVYYSLNKLRFRFIFITLFSLFVVFISATRSFIVSNLIILSFIILFYTIKTKAGYLKKVLAFLFIILFFSLIILNYKSDVYQFLKLKFESTINTELKENKGTYAFRKRLIEESIVANKSTNSVFFGKGYVRSGKKGSYDFVLGGDTLLAPVIYCEGYSGLVIRIFPIFYFIMFALKYRSTLGFSQFLSISIFSLIISSIIGYVQTTIFYNYIDFILFIYIAERYLSNQGENVLEYDYATIP